MGEDWQEEYYVWDCCAGTGNLLAGLTNKYNIYASTIDKAKVACENVNQLTSDHFIGINKKVELGSGAQREIEDLMLTRYACYLVAQNGDPRKEQIAFAQTYFAVQTRKAELIEQRLLEVERVKARAKYALGTWHRT